MCLYAHKLLTLRTVSGSSNVTRKIIQENLADAKVSARQHCMYMKAPSEEIYSKSTICDILLRANTNRGRITYGLRDIFGCRG